MKYAISNIAWQQHDDPIILELLQQSGMTGIEVAPSKLWPNWEGASYKKAAEYRQKMQQYGFELPAMQAILFAKPSLQLFDAASHQDFFEHIQLLAELANGFGSKVLVFGAPKNRIRGQTPYTKAVDIASEFFYKAAEIVQQQGCVLALEHNPVEYGCDFITNVLDAKALVERVDQRGFKLHVDSAGLHLCGGELAEMIVKAGKFVHYHISEPMLEPIVNGVVDQKQGLDQLQSINYPHWVSIEMKQPATLDLLKQSLIYIQELI